MTEGLENTDSGGDRVRSPLPLLIADEIGGSARRARGLNFRNKKILILSFQPLSSKLLFLRCLPYITNVTPRNTTGYGRGEGCTALSRCIKNSSDCRNKKCVPFLLPCVLLCKI